MSKVIRKYVGRFGWIDVNASARILLVDEQPQRDLGLCVWAEVDENEEKMVALRIVGTGMDVPEGMRHVGSVVCRDGYVWHVYDPRPQ